VTVRIRPVRAVLAGAAAAALAVTAAPAAAHPFGPPSTAHVTVDGTRVTIAWRAAEDDWVALGHALGAFENPSLGPVATELTGEQKLRRSTRVHDYLLDRITVRQDDAPCPGRVVALDRLLDQGARLRFECSAEVAELDITLTALTDLNEAYRTVLTSQTPAVPRRVLFTAAEPTHRMRFSADGGGPGRTGPLVGAGAALATALAALAVTRLWRRVRSRS